jgi:signal transduction histidine kinase
MNYQLTTESLVEIITAFAAFVTIGFLWKKRKSPEVKYLILLELFVAVWAVTYAFEFATNHLQTKIMWSKLSYFGIAFIPVFYFLFTTAFSQKSKIITRQNILLLSVLPVVTIGLILTNDIHHWVWVDVSLDPVLNIAHYHHGIWFWVYWSYAMLLLLFGLFNLIHSIYKFTEYYKSQITILLIATLFPIVGNVMYVTGINPFPGFDWTPVSFVLTGLIIAFGIVRYKIFDLVPFARDRLINTMNDGVIVVNYNGVTEDCNASLYSIFSLEETSVIHENFEDIFAAYEPLVKAVKTKRTEKIQVKIDEKYYQAQISPIYNRRKEFWGSLVILHDITDIKEVESELKKTNQQLLNEIEIREKLIEDLDSFTHTVAHDLKNTLGTIVSSGEILEEMIKTEDNKHGAQLASLIKNSAGKAVQITRELLILAWSSHKGIETNDLEMNSIFEEAKEQLDELIQKKQAEIHLPKSWLTAKGYAPWIEEVWVNYLSNALKYSGTTPKIEVGSVPSENNMVKYWIKDNGKGLTAEEQSKLFQKYVRFAPQGIAGHGLGLTIVKRIIEKLGGTVGVESDGKTNRGTLFYFTLPAG